MTEAQAVDDRETWPGDEGAMVTVIWRGATRRLEVWSTDGGRVAMVVERVEGGEVPVVVVRLPR